MAEGVWADGLVLESTDGAITITGIGGQGNKITAGYGVEFYNSSVTLSDSQSLSIRGEGATATNQIDSIDNAGLSLIDTITAQSLDLVGLGGEGENTGIEPFDTTITASKGSVSIKERAAKERTSSRPSECDSKALMRSEDKSKQTPSPSQETVEPAICAATPLMRAERTPSNKLPTTLVW